MAIHFELRELEESLRAGYGDLNEAAREALLIDAYRTGRLSAGRLAETLGRSVSATMVWLDEHRVGPNYSVEDYGVDCKSMGQSGGK